MTTWLKRGGIEEKYTETANPEELKRLSTIPVSNLHPSQKAALYAISLHPMNHSPPPDWDHPPDDDIDLNWPDWM